MEMKEVFEKLEKLQNILVEKYAIEDKLREEPKQVNQYNALLEQTRKKYIDKNTDYEDVKSEIYSLRTELDAAVKSLESGEKGMDNIATHREYEALKIQISEAEAKEKDVREKLKKQEKIANELKESLDALKEEVDDYERMIAESQKDIDKNTAAYTKELEKLEKEAEKIKPGLDEELVYKFERIIEHKTNGIVSVKSSAGGKYGVCVGCQMILPAQFANEVREGKKIEFCPYCSRILKYEESSEEDDIYNLDEAGSLIDDDDDYDDESDEEREENEESFDENYSSDDEDESEVDDEDDSDEDDSDEEEES